MNYGTSSFRSLIGGLCALVIGTLFKFRALWFLKADTIVSGGKEMPTAEFAAYGARIFFVVGILFVAGALVGIVRSRRKISN